MLNSIQENDNSSNVNAIAISPEGKHIISGGLHGKLKIWDLQSGNLLFECQGHDSPIATISITPNGQQFVSGSLDNKIKIWDFNTKEKQPL